MKRLTERDEFGNADIIGVDSADLQLNLDFDDFNRVTDALNRLAAYEDTVLEPEEIYKLCEMEKRTRMAKMIRLEQAESEGRLLVLPCKVGTHLWKVTHPFKQEPKVTEFVVKNIRTAGKKHRMQIEVQAVNVPGTNWMDPYRFYYTREEAEQALEDYNN